MGRLRTLTGCLFFRVRAANRHHGTFLRKRKKPETFSDLVVEGEDGELLPGNRRSFLAITLMGPGRKRIYARQRFLFVEREFWRGTNWPEEPR